MVKITEVFGDATSPKFEEEFIGVQLSTEKGEIFASRGELSYLVDRLERVIWERQ